MADTKQLADENEVLKQFMELLGGQGMGEQSQGFMELFKYVADMQLKLAVMAEELQDVRQQLGQLQSQPKTVRKNLMAKVESLQEKIAGLSERLVAVKERLAETAAQAVSAFKEKGKAEMCRIVQKGTAAVRPLLAGCRERLADAAMDCQKTADQIDSIGDELKQIGNSFSNVGRLLAGKGTKEAPDEKTGIGLTRALNRPVKKAAETLRDGIASVDRALEKLDRLPERFNAGKEAEKGGRASLKDKLAQMKAKTGRQKEAPEPDKAKSRAECL